MAGQSWFQDLFEELKRRRVIRVATLYVVVFWPIIQVVDILSPALGLPDSAMRYLVIAFVSGLPIVLIFAWIFDLNQDGLVRDTGDSGEESGPALIGSKAELGIIAFMVMLAGALLYVQLTTIEPELVADVPVVQKITGAIVKDMAPPNSIAVLPFDPFSDDPRDRFFADGLTEELLNVLTTVNGLEVAARTSSFAYRGSNKLIRDIGTELNVDVILEGSVRRNDIDNQIRVTAQLIDTRTGKHYFSKAFDHDFSDVFKIQDEISRSVVDELKVTLLGGEAERMKSHASANPESMITYSMGQSELVKRTKVGIEDARRFFRRAIEVDENYVQAWVGLADAYTLTASYEYGDRDESLAEAQKAVTKALELDPKSGMAWASQGLIHRNQFRKEEAVEAFRKALELSPSYAMAHMWYAGMLDDEDERLSHYEKAYKLDPRSPVAGFNVASMLIERGREAEAMQVFSRIVEADPFFPRAYDLVARISVNRGRIGEGIRQYEKAYELQPNTNTAFQIANLYNRLGSFAMSEEWAARSRPNEPPERLFMYDLLEAERYAMQNDLEKARDVIRRMKENQGEHQLGYLLSSYASYLTEDWEGAIADWHKSEEYKDDPNDQISFSTDVYLNARLGTAFALIQTGRREEGEAMIVEVSSKLEDAVARGYDNGDIWHYYALIDAIKGDRRMAMIGLQRAISEGWRQYWYPRVDPAFRAIMSPELETMMAGLETQIQLMRDQLAFEQSFASTRSEPGKGS